MRICILRLSALGDIVMCLPLIRTLQESFPEAEITWVIGKAFYPLFEHIKGVNFIPISKIRSFRDWQAAKKILAPHQFDLLLATQASFSAHLLYMLIHAKRKIGYDRIRSKDFHRFFIDESIEFHKEHTVEGFLRFATTIGAKKISYDGRICLKEEKSPYQFPYFVVNPCSSKVEKDWNYVNYIPVIQFVQKNFGLAAIITGVTSDQAVCSELEKKSGAINLCGKTSLQELGSLLKHATFLLSPDTGPAHIASALGTPVVGLFGPTSAHLTGPYFSKEYRIDKHAEVLKKYGSAKEKKLGWNVRVYHKQAMDLISVDDVQKTIAKLIEAKT